MKKAETQKPPSDPTGSMKPPGRRGRNRDTTTEARILAAARAVFVRSGTAGARMQEIAEEAGVNQALLHYYFRSKDQLAQAVFRELGARIVPSITSIFASDEDLALKIERFVHTYIDLVRQNPFIPGYILAEVHFNPERLAALAEQVTGSNPASAIQLFIPRLRAQLNQQAAIGAMRSIAPEQFLVNLIALCVFPFAARPVLRIVLGQDDAAFNRFLDERRVELPDFILNALRP
ncbi:MAG: helix-turn-helix domain-containing protein [Gemmatimonadaceae bacterium]